MQQLQLDVQHQCDEAAHAQHEAQRMAEQVAHALNQNTVLFPLHVWGELAHVGDLSAAKDPEDLGHQA